MSSTWQMRIPSKVLFSFQKKIPGLIELILCTKLKKLFFNLKTYFWTIDTFLKPPDFVGVGFFRSVDFSLDRFSSEECSMILVDFKRHLFEVSTDKADRIPILLHHGESVQKSWISSNHLTHNLALVIGFSSINFFEMIYCVETHGWLSSSTSV